MTYIETLEEAAIQDAPPRQTAPLKIGRDAKHRPGRGGFSIERRDGDSGVGAIGRIDDASVAPGTLVPMHPHRDDEIITYLRSGGVMHRDTVGEGGMGYAGAAHAHEGRERVPARGAGRSGRRRPARTSDLPAPERRRAGAGGPLHDFGEPVSHRKWRRIARPEADAPLRVRSTTWVEDAHFAKGEMAAVPVAAVEDATRLLYVFAGSVTVDGVELAAGESAILPISTETLEMLEDSDLVLFSTDESAPAFKGGMLSGNALTPG